MTEAQTLFARLSREIADAAAAVAPSIVQVHGRPRGPASGMVVAPGRVLTTSHSVEWDEGVTVLTLDGARLEASIVGHARGADLVLLAVPGLKAPSVTLDGAAVRTGELALLAGRSWRGRPAARLTVIGSVAGPLMARDGTRIDEVLSLTTSAYPGFSGSALVGSGGAVAGIATAGLFRGAALAIPAGAARALVDSIERHGGVRRGFLGVTSQPVRVPARQRGSLATEHGLLVLGIAPDSPADRAGLLVGDIMVRAGGADLETPEDLLALLGPERVGQPLDVLVLRGGAQETVTITVGERPRRA
ncbi:MAG TPA: trypsin-like peptidase domain-containing protein [Vicinamibacterales bacterium]|nr:trypsin-like peptidase domain-containing protein [Vicinamibacterales bacterium]